MMQSKTKNRWSRPWCGGLTALLVLACVSCGGLTPKPQTIVVINADQYKARMKFEAFKLLMSPAEARAVIAQEGMSAEWKDPGAETSEAKVTARVGEIEACTLHFEGEYLVRLLIQYRQANPARAAIRKHYRAKRKQLDGTWAMTDDRRETIVLVDRQGLTLTAIHAEKARDRKDIEKMFELVLGERPGQRPAEAERDPSAAEAR